MQTKSKRHWSLFFATVALACASAPHDPKAIPPGINDVFLDEDMSVDRFVGIFEGESREIYAERAAIVAALDLSRGDVVADIGAGTGFFSWLFADAVGSTGRVVAVEISPRFLDHLRREKASRGLAHFSIVEGTERSVALPPNSTDLAFVCDVYHHFEYPSDSLASLYEAIRPGGSLVLIDFHRIPGKTRPFLLDHVRAGREIFQSEIESAGFRFVEEIALGGLEENYVLRFERP